MNIHYKCCSDFEHIILWNDRWFYIAIAKRGCVETHEQNIW